MRLSSVSTPRRFRPLSLDALNFLLADVRGALGPYLNVFLVTQQHWSQSEVGVMTTIGGFLGLAVQTPIGAAIDETRAKRGAIVLSLAVLAVGSMVLFVVPTFWPVTIANTLIAIVGDVFGPAVAALTLGLYARERLARWVTFSRSGPSSCWCLSSRSCRCSRCCPSRAIPLITTAPGGWMEERLRPIARARRRRPDTGSCTS